MILFPFPLLFFELADRPFALSALCCCQSRHLLHVHRMAQNEPEHTLPVFVQNNSLPAFDKKDFSTAEICSYAEEKKQPGSTR